MTEKAPESTGRYARPPIVSCLLFFLLSGILCATEAGSLPLRPGETLPQPRQRGLNEVAELPTRDMDCPACSFVAAVPDVDKLMRQPPGDEAPKKWQMHAASRDADLCPHPGPGKLAFQADIVICPSCGFSAPLVDWAIPMPASTRTWIVDTFRPAIRAAEMRLLGERGGGMAEEEIVAFFNRQSDIPDIVRTEHHRILSIARKDPALERARASWLAAWAIRRELAAPPRGEFLARRSVNVQAVLDKSKRERDGLADEAKALAYLLGRERGGKERVSAADRLAVRMLLAGVKTRQGMGDKAMEIYAEMLQFCRERYIRPDQDPLWPATNGRAAREIRQRELETFRDEAEAEILARMDLHRRHETLLKETVDLLRTAVTSGELDGKPEEALFHAYLIGEYLRRAGDLPLASEWFKLVLGVAPMQSPLETAARLQLEQVKEQAGDRVNLLSAVGEDGELLERIRIVCRKE